MYRIVTVAMVTVCLFALGAAQAPATKEGKGGMLGGLFGRGYPFSQPTATQLTTLGFMDSDLTRTMFPFFPKEMYCMVCVSSQNFLCMRQYCS